MNFSEAAEKLEQLRNSYHNMLNQWCADVLEEIPEALSLRVTVRFEDDEFYAGITVDFGHARMDSLNVEGDISDKECKRLWDTYGEIVTQREEELMVHADTLGVIYGCFDDNWCRAAQPRRPSQAR